MQSWFRRPSSPHDTPALLNTQVQVDLGRGRRALDPLVVNPAASSHSHALMWSECNAMKPTATITRRDRNCL